MSPPDSRVPPRQTLPDLFREFCELPSEALQYDNGYRSWRYTWAQVGNAAHAFAARLSEHGIGRGNCVMIWSENRPEWVAAFWGCLLTAAMVVPIDYRSSASFLRRVQERTGARLIVTGDEVRLPAWDGRPLVWPLAELSWPTQSIDSTIVPSAPDDVAEIVFTSGATGEPKGVLLTHRNILTNVAALDEIVRRYRKWFRPLFPLRFLGLIPLSHMFGQVLTLFFPVLIPGAAVFLRGHNPQEIVRQIRLRRVSVVIGVPRILEVLRANVLHHFPDAADAARNESHWMLRWWRYRNIHAMFGWKFWAFAVGAAPLAADLEAFWNGLGFPVIQGYGLTETSPIVAFNNPFDLKEGTVGKPIPGLEVRLGPDAEILVRGAGVTPGYFHDAEKTAATFVDSWLHTGDTGSFDADGYLTIHGRSKEMIVTPEGLNVIPEDVEQVLNQIAGVRESAVVGRDRVHAVLVIETGAELNEILRLANARLEEHQKIRNASVWPGEYLPRTEGTQKLKHDEIARWVEGGSQASAAGAPESVLDLVQRRAPGRVLEPHTTLDDLGLSSLDRVELLMDLEQHFEAGLDESWLTGARSVADLQRAMAAPRTAKAATAELAADNWNRSWWTRGLRWTALTALWLPLTHRYARVHAAGQQHLAGLQGPVLFAANHQSHLDTPVILGALPARYRHRTAVAMWKEYFDARYHPERYLRRARLLNSLTFWLVTFFFHTFVLPQTEAGAGQSLRHMGELVSRGWSILLFPEGERTERGEIRPFLPGIGFMAARLQVPVVPVCLQGLERVLHRHAHWPRRGPVAIRFGTPLHLRGEDYPALAAEVEQAVRALAGQGWREAA